MTDIHPADQEVIDRFENALRMRSQDAFAQTLKQTVTRQDLKWAVEALKRPWPKPPDREPGLYAVKWTEDQAEWDIAHFDGFWSVMGEERAYDDHEFAVIGGKVTFERG